MWNNWFRKAIGETVLTCSGETTTFRHQSSARNRRRRRAWRGRHRGDGGTARKTTGTHSSECRPSVALLTSLVVVVRGAGEIGARMDERTRQWMLYTSNQRCAALLLFTVVVQAFFGRFSLRLQLVKRSRLRQLTVNRLPQRCIR